MTNAASTAATSHEPGRAATKARSRAKPAARKRKPDVIARLRADHREVAALHEAYQKLVAEQADAGARGALAGQICQALTAHAIAEEEVLYRALRAVLDEQDLLDEADIEHASAKRLIGEIEALHPGADKYDARVVVLCEYIAHHVKEEEREIFPKARNAKELDLKALGEAFAQRKAELIAAQAAS